MIEVYTNSENDMPGREWLVARGYNPYYFLSRDNGSKPPIFRVGYAQVMRGLPSGGLEPCFFFEPNDAVIAMLFKLTWGGA